MATVYFVVTTDPVAVYGPFSRDGDASEWALQIMGSRVVWFVRKAYRPTRW